MSNFSEKDFKEKLEATHKFPALYMFKFIVPESKTGEVKALFPLNEVNVKPSSDAIIGVYEKAKRIEGIMAL